MLVIRGCEGMSDAACTTGPDPSYYGHTRAEMLAFVPKNAARLLDVGCGEGVFGEKLKRALEAEVWGVEFQPEAAEKARQRLDKVIVGNITAVLDDLPAGYFDCIVFNDVLEHLPDPDTVLLRIKSKLASAGRIVCSIPNVRHVSVLKELLIRKRWEYKGHGPLDRTHLRFFTQKSIQDMFQRLGFDLTTIKGLGGKATWRFLLLNLLTFGFFADTRYLQFACVAKPRLEPGITVNHAAATKP